ncbi:hypothetical protein CB1_000633004 [Camelus ferus]|nr:hypothetical protein CB1_000633004 [Camelus ferus]
MDVLVQGSEEAKGRLIQLGGEQYIQDTTLLVARVDIWFPAARGARGPEMLRDSEQGTEVLFCGSSDFDEEVNQAKSHWPEMLWTQPIG